MAPPSVVAFGRSEHSFYIGCGLRYYAPGMPNSLTRTVNEMGALQTPWLAIDGQAQVWIARDMYRSKLNYDAGIPSDLLEELKGNVEYVAFGAIKEQYFASLGTGYWSVRLQNGPATRAHDKIRAEVGADKFDASLTGMVFGKWNVDYFYLIFKHKPSGRIEMQWNLPQTMQAKLKELREYADTPEGKREIARHEETELMLATQRYELSLSLSYALRRAAWNPW